MLDQANRFDVYKNCMTYFVYLNPSPEVYLSNAAHVPIATNIPASEKIIRAFELIPISLDS
jgi:hypothetical protein